MKRRYFRTLQRRVFLKYSMIVAALCIGGALCLYLFDNVLNGVIIDFLRVLLIDQDPFKMFKNLFSIFLPAVIIISGFLLVWFLCKDMGRYLRLLMEAADDVTIKRRTRLRLPEEMRQGKEALLNLAEEYRQFEAAAKEDEEKKKDLIYLLAQDIKLPLSNVLMYMEFLRKERQISEEIRKDFTRQILYKSLDLEDMINEFFDITRFNLQYAKWNPEHLYLERMLAQVCDEAYGMMEEKGMELSYHCSVQCPLYADNEKIARALRDLLRNLIELGKEQGSIRITLTENASFYEICMQADTRHLTSYQIAHIFHNYYRLEDVQESRRKHVLGLGIAKQIVEMHKGMLRAASLKEQLAFYVTLPKAAVKQTEAPKPGDKA